MALAALPRPLVRFPVAGREDAPVPVPVARPRPVMLPRPVTPPTPVMPHSPATPLSPPSIPAAGPPAGIAAGTSAGFSVAGLLPTDAAAAAPAVRMVHVSTTAG